VRVMTQVAVKRVEPRWHQPSPAPAPPPRPADPSNHFADYVRARLDGPILRYSQRLTLLKEAQRQGLGRFEANLVIAKVLHQEGMGQTYELRPKSTWLGMALVIALLQSLIVAGIWWMVG
jgi:hypothetical protein